MCDQYKRLYADLLTKPKDQVHQALLENRAVDSVKIIQIIKECAYNQTVKEQGLDASYCYAEGKLHKLASSLL